MCYSGDMLNTFEIDENTGLPILPEKYSWEINESGSVNIIKFVHRDTDEIKPGEGYGYSPNLWYCDRYRVIELEYEEIEVEAEYVRDLTRWEKILIALHFRKDTRVKTQKEHLCVSGYITVANSMEYKDGNWNYPKLSSYITEETFNEVIARVYQRFNNYLKVKDTEAYRKNLAGQYPPKKLEPPMDLKALALTIIEQDKNKED